MAINLTLTNLLCGAAHVGDCETICRALDEGADPNQSNNSGWTPLRCASERGKAGAVRLLVERGADVNRGERVAGDLSYLHHAAQFGDAETVCALLAAGSDPEARDRNGKTPLYYAAHAVLCEPVAVANTLIAAGARIDAADNYGATPLHRAAEATNVAMVRALLALGVDTNTADLAGYTPLHYAVHNRASALFRAKDDVIRLLLNAGANPNAAAHRSSHGKGATPLILAASQAPTSVVEQLIRAGADVNVIDAAKRTPVSEAIGRSENFAALLTAGANITPLTKGSNGKPALLTAAEKGNTVAVDALLAAGSDPNKMYRGKAPLHLAAAKSHTTVVAALLAAGADHLLADKDGVSPLDTARKRRRKSVLVLLEAAETARLAASTPSGA